MSFQASKGKSQSWKESVDSTAPSIWTRDLNTPYPSGLSAQLVASSDPSLFPKGKENGMGGLRLPCRELQMKRSREGKCLT